MSNTNLHIRLSPSSLTRWNVTKAQLRVTSEELLALLMSGFVVDDDQSIINEVPLSWETGAGWICWKDGTRDRKREQELNK